MTLDDWIHAPGSWLASGNESGVIVSSRIRLARNIEGVAFPGWAGEDECVKIQARILSCLPSIPILSPSLALDMTALSPVDREFLRERHLVSNDLARKTKGSGVVVRHDEMLSVMVNALRLPPHSIKLRRTGATFVPVPCLLHPAPIGDAAGVPYPGVVGYDQPPR